MLVCKQFLGRPFVWGKSDCFTLAQDIYRENYGIELTNYARYEGWEYDGNDWFTEYFEREGFRSVPYTNVYKEVREGDVLLMAIYNTSQGRGSGVANHCAVYVGNGLMAHHMYGKPSELRRFNTGNAVLHLIRHKDITPQEKPVEKVDFMDMLPKRKQEILRNALRTAEGNA